MVWTRVGLSIASTLVLSHALGCGGTTRNAGSGAAGNGASSSGGTETGGSGGGSNQGPAEPCAPMDARASGDDCAGIAGYRYNGALCEPIVCSCVGSECDRVFATMEECDDAYQLCYAQRGLTRGCEKHGHCSLVQRTCCPACGIPGADSHLALGLDAVEPQASGLCLGDPDAACPKCASRINPSVYAACIEGQCRVVDVTATAACQRNAECGLVTKDCCDCGGDFGPLGVMAVSQSYVRPARCDGIGCDGCVPEPPADTHAICYTDVGVCGLITELH